MQPMSWKLVGCAVAFMALARPCVHANVDADANPYATIVDRNPFGLKPPPPPPPPPEQTAPPVPMAKVTMTGLLSTFGEPRVLLEIIEEPGKGGGTPKKPILREGERMGPVEILAIDVVKNSVRIRNSGVETNMTFPEVAKAGPAAGGPGLHGAPPAFTPPGGGVPTAGIPQPHAPTVISANNANGGGGVTVLGGATANPGGAAVPSALGSTDGGMRSIPQRPLRTENNYGALPNMTKEQADLLIEANRLRNQASGVVPPLPPTQLTPLFNDAAAGDQPPANTPPPGSFPRFPANPRTPPPIPR